MYEVVVVGYVVVQVVVQQLVVQQGVYEQVVVWVVVGVYCYVVGLVIVVVVVFVDVVVIVVVVEFGVDGEGFVDLQVVIDGDVIGFEVGIGMLVVFVVVGVQGVVYLQFQWSL